MSYLALTHQILRRILRLNVALFHTVKLCKRCYPKKLKIKTIGGRCESALATGKNKVNIGISLKMVFVV